MAITEHQKLLINRAIRYHVMYPNTNEHLISGLISEFKQYCYSFDEEHFRYLESMKEQAIAEASELEF